MACTRTLVTITITLKILFFSFQLVTSFQPKDFNLVSANKPCNQLKNRTLDLLPVESARVHLTPKPGVDGSDYINATWFQGTDIFIYKVYIIYNKFVWLKFMYMKLALSCFKNRYCNSF